MQGNRTLSAAESGESTVAIYRPPVCVYRDEPTCGLDGESCRQPCAVLGFAVAVWYAGYQHWTREKVLDRLCNPREYESDAEYQPYLEFLGARV